MKTAIKVNKTKDYITIAIPNDLIIHLTDTSGGIKVTDRKPYLNEIHQILKIDLGDGTSDIEKMLVDVIQCAIDSGSENIEEVTE